MADRTADQLRAELRAALAANISSLRDAVRAELARGVTLEPGRRMQFEVDPFFYGITSCGSEEPLLMDWLDGSLPADWYDRAEEALGGWDALVSEELCPWFAECWQEAGGPQRYSPAFLFFHGCHNNQYDLEGRRWLSATTLDEAWDARCLSRRVGQVDPQSLVVQSVGVFIGARRQSRASYLRLQDSRMDDLRYYREHPPSSIAEFAAHPVERPPIGFDGHGQELNTFFNLSCRCGGHQHYVLGHYWRNPDYHNVLVFLSPLALQCAQCNGTTELIDTNRHGYDAEIGGIVATAHGVGDRTAFNCDTCGLKPFAICVRFEYSEDLFDEDYAEFHGREQDLFSWFSVIGKCAGCSRLMPITEFECA